MILKISLLIFINVINTKFQLSGGVREGGGSLWQCAHLACDTLPLPTISEKPHKKQCAECRPMRNLYCPAFPAARACFANFKAQVIRGVAAGWRETLYCDFMYHEYVNALFYSSLL